MLSDTFTISTNGGSIAFMHFRSNGVGKGSKSHVLLFMLSITAFKSLQLSALNVEKTGTACRAGLGYCGACSKIFAGP